MKRVTFCLVCGATPAASARRCSHCGAPLRSKRKRRGVRLPKIGRPSLLAVLVSLAVIAVLVALVTLIVVG